MPTIPTSEIPTGEWPSEAKQFLTNLYARFGTDQTAEQQYNVLHLELGGGEERHFYPSDLTWEQKRTVLEYEILGNLGLIELMLC